MPSKAARSRWWSDAPSSELNALGRKIRPLPERFGEICPFLPCSSSNALSSSASDDLLFTGQDAPSITHPDLAF
ncbi:MAG: hypothetical protein AAFW82_02765 [Pseudomonadota bacterium]